MIFLGFAMAFLANGSIEMAVAAPEYLHVNAVSGMAASASWAAPIAVAAGFAKTR